MDRIHRLVVVCVALAAFIYQFESNLVNVALPTICHELGLTTTQVSFIPICYLVGSTFALIPMGRLGWIFGLKRVFLFSVGIMVFGTGICGFSHTFPVVLAGRLIQGMGAGGMASLGYALIPAKLPASLAGYGYGRLSMAAGLGMLAGNPAGGFLAQFLTWRFVFLSTVPLMLILFLFSWKALSRDEKPAGTRWKMAAFADSICLGLAATSLVFILSYGSELGLSSALIRSAILVFVSLCVILIVRGRSGKIEFLPLAMIRNRNFVVSLPAIMLVGAVMSGVVFLMPFHLEGVSGLSPATASLFMLFNAAAYAFAAPFGGSKANRGSTAKKLLIGSAVAGILASGFFSICSGHAHWIYAMIFLVVSGAANGVFSPAANRTALATLPDALREQASAFLPLAIMVGCAIGVSLLETVFSLGRSTAETAGNGAEGFMRAFAVSALIWGGAMICVLNLKISTPEPQ